MIKKIRVKCRIYILVSVMAVASIIFGCALYLRLVYSGPTSIDYFLEFTANNTATNDDYNITTWEIIAIHREPCIKFSAVTWQLIDDSNVSINLKGVMKDSNDFTDKNIKNDSLYQLYFLDKDDDYITPGDTLKIKAPENGEYKIKAVIPVFGGKKIDYTCWISPFTHY